MGERGISMAVFAPRRILCPVDFSDYSAKALQVAGRLAESFGAEVRVLHAQRLDAPVYFTSAQIQSLRKQLRRSLREAREFVEDFAARNLPEGVRRSVRLVEREPIVAILNMHKEWGSSLIVMSTHGRTGLTRLRLGSVTESVLRQMKAPILTVGPGMKKLPASSTRILTPVDLSDASRETLGISAELAARTGGEVTALHILEHAEEGDASEASRALCDWIPPQTRSRCGLQEVVAEGKTSEVIATEARRRRADLIVLGARPRSYLGQLMFGSTTETVIRTAPCPVLSVILPPRNRVTV